MSTTTITVRVGDELADFIDWNTGKAGSFETASEYVRDLIRRDRERVERERIDWLKAHLSEAFAAPDSEFVESSAAKILARHRPRP